MKITVNIMILWWILGVSVSKDATLGFNKVKMPCTLFYQIFQSTKIKDGVDSFFKCLFYSRLFCYILKDGSSQQRYLQMISNDDPYRL